MQQLAVVFLWARLVEKQDALPLKLQQGEPTSALEMPPAPLRHPETAHIRSRRRVAQGHSFRDNHSLRCHREQIEVGSVARGMGHSLEVHARSYRWSSDKQTAAAFDAAFPTIRVW